TRRWLARAVAVGAAAACIDRTGTAVLCTRGHTCVGACVTNAPATVGVLHTRGARSAAHRWARLTTLGVLRGVAHLRAAARARPRIAGLARRAAVPRGRIDLTLVLRADVGAALGVGAATGALDSADAAAADAAVAAQRAAVERFAAADAVGKAEVET